MTCGKCKGEGHAAELRERDSRAGAVRLPISLELVHSCFLIGTNEGELQTSKECQRGQQTSESLSSASGDACADIYYQLILCIYYLLIIWLTPLCRLMRNLQTSAVSWDW